MRIGIFAKTFPGTDPQEVLRATADAGFACAQYNMACSGLPSMPDAIAQSALQSIAQASTQIGVELVALSATYNMIHPDKTQRQQGHQRLEVLAKAANSLSIPLLTLCTGTRDAQDQWRAHPDNQTAEAWRDLHASMAVAIEIADRHNVNLGIEPELANVVNSAEAAKRLIDDLQSPRLRIVFDPANLFEVASLAQQRNIVEHAAYLLGDRISICHAKDRQASGAFAAAGQGVLDYPHFMKCLEDVGFDGPLITHGLDAADAPQVSRFLARLLA